MLPSVQSSSCAPTAPLIAHVPGPLYVGLMDQETPVPAGKGSFTAPFAAAPPELLAIATVNPIGFPAVTDEASGVFVTVTSPAFAGGKATTTSLNCFVRAPIVASTGFVGLKNVVISNSNWQKIGGFVATGGLPTCIAVLQFVPNGDVVVTA